MLSLKRRVEKVDLKEVTEPLGINVNKLILQDIVCRLLSSGIHVLEDASI